MLERASPLRYEGIENHPYKERNAHARETPFEECRGVILQRKKQITGSHHEQRDGKAEQSIEDGSPESPVGRGRNGAVGTAVEVLAGVKQHDTEAGEDTYIVKKDDSFRVGRLGICHDLVDWAGDSWT